MVFVTAGMGGGTGTGGAAVVANIAKSQGALVVAIVTRPFSFEGKRRSKLADEGIEELRKHVDTLIIIPNQKLLALVEHSTSFLDGFSIANQVLYNATRGISELIIRHGYINVDFADVRTVMKEMGDAIMGSGVATGEHRAARAAENAISSPLLEGVSIQGAQGVLVNITGGRSMTLLEVSEATQIIHDAAGDDANLIFGAVLDDSMSDEVMVTVIATGFNLRPKFTGLAYGQNSQLPLAMPQENSTELKPRVERMTAPMSDAQRMDRRGVERGERKESRPMTADDGSYSGGQPLPKIERMYTRGTLTEKSERTSSFERPSIDRDNEQYSVSGSQSRGSALRLTPKNDARHVPSGPRDLKEFDQPAYLRRGIDLPPIEDAETEQTAVDARANGREAAQKHQEAIKVEQAAVRQQNDRPAFLRRIMD
jgi:cell division protein FtsZ